MLIEINKLENKIKNIKTTGEMKKLVNEMFKNIEINDIDFNDLIYQDVIPRLEELGVVFDRESDIDYEIVMKEEY